ncbi:HlyD family type I secretion periplasmic adaptor subunit [Pseudomonas gingeri]|uniref:Membrane fusion protein (MFP) family protein n=2 Tax=Pseudomonas gingeri TaxID=117681 RepID=A0A7Y8C4B1_9PSED|nr:HlyD family type I secretion periplasmic adaptor subunit [Pseudomonas gingeri]
MDSRMLTRWRAFADLLSHYKAVFKAYWAVREKRGAPVRQSEELQFLPAHLELIDTPVHPLPRWTAKIICALVVLVIMIGIFFDLDIVVVAKGKLVPDERVKVIQPALTGVVRQILVRDGQVVSAGQLLIRLDDTQASADTDKAQSSKLDSGFAAARAKALIQAQASHTNPMVGVVEGATAERQREAQRFVEGAYREYLDKLDSAQAQLAKRLADLEETRQQIAKLKTTAPIARQQANDYKDLSVGKYVATHDYLEKEKAAVEAEHELSGQTIHARELSSAIQEQQAEIKSLASQFRREQLDELEKSSQQVTQSQDDQTKAQTRQQLLRITAPVAGTVQQLAVHTLGGVVTTAQSLMEVVPDDSLEVEVTIDNKDVGFVSVGQSVAVKVDAFPYTRYGFLDGTVTSVSNDSLQDKKLGLAFSAHVHLAENRMRIDNKWVQLTPGMSVSAEIKTGKRNVAGYFFGPLVQGAQESMRER